MSKATDGARGDEGMTLVETLITMIIFAALLAAVFSAVSSGRRIFTVADDDATGVIDIRPAVERLGRDVRNARALDPGATTGQVKLWIDSNSDYQRQASEVVSWSIVANGDHYNVQRQVGSGAAQIQASTIVSAIAFCYRQASTTPCLTATTTTPLSATEAAQARIVETTMTYDPRVSNGASQRQIVFSERLRNVG